MEQWVASTCFSRDGLALSTKNLHVKLINRGEGYGRSIECLLLPTGEIVAGDYPRNRNSLMHKRYIPLYLSPCRAYLVFRVDSPSRLISIDPLYTLRKPIRFFILSSVSVPFQICLCIVSRMKLKTIAQISWIRGYCYKKIPENKSNLI